MRLCCVVPVPIPGMMTFLAPSLGIIGIRTDRSGDRSLRGGDRVLHVLWEAIYTQILPGDSAAANMTANSGSWNAAISGSLACQWSWCERPASHG